MHGSLTLGSEALCNNAFAPGHVSIHAIVLRVKSTLMAIRCLPWL